MQFQEVLLSTAYFAPVQVYAKIFQYKKVQIEQYETFPKQTYRNRANILAANGVLPITVPVIKENNYKTKDVKISDHTDWRRIHLQAIRSAYENSPFYEFYIDELAAEIRKGHTFLLDLNMGLHTCICENIGINPVAELTADFIFPDDATCADFRYSIHPKPQNNKEDPDFEPVRYIQVFHEKFGFVPNLSIIDLLFNEGPNTITILEKSSNFDVVFSSVRRTLKHTALKKRGTLKRAAES